MYWIRLGILCAAYAVTAKLGLQADAVGGFASLVWPPTGIALAALVLLGYRLWPAIALAAFVVNFSNGAPLLTAALIGAGNTLEALLGAYLLRHVARFQPSLARVRDVSALVLFAVLLSPVVSATIGVTSLWLGGVIPPPSFTATWVAWWLGDAMGSIIVAPLFFVWSQNREIIPQKARFAEGLALGLILIVLSVAVFHGRPGLAENPYLSSYLVFPLLIWSALRFDPRATAMALFAVSVVAIWGAVRGLGPFMGSSLQMSLLPLQLFMSVAASSMLMLAAAMAEMRAAIRARDDFLSIASHELKTPITSLKLQVQLMLRGARSQKPLDSEKFLRRSERVDLELTRMARLVNTLLDVARISVGRLTLTVEQVDLGKLVAGAIAASEDESAESHPIALEVKQPVVGHWDRLRLEQLVSNLTTNAIKFGADKPIHITVAAKGDRAILTVADRGIGIPSSRLPFIFDRFERAVSERSYGGLGLGLYICRQIAEAHGGSIRVRSKLGEGSCFTVELPLN